MTEMQQGYLIVVVIWVIVGAVAAFLYFNRNAELKRRLWPSYVIACSIVFLFFGWWIAPIEIFYAAVPLVALITFINLRAVKFCDACGATAQNLPFRRARFCPRCGAPLQR